MTDRGIIFSAPMVNALLHGRKTETRRLATSPLAKCRAGDRLWVRETCRAEELDDGLDGVRYLADEGWRPIANSREAADRWLELLHYGKRRGANVPSIHMPRWASRLTLLVQAVRFEPLQAITDASAYAEGIVLESADPPFWYVPYVPTEKVCSLIEAPGSGAAACYGRLWEHLHGTDSWDANPDVVVLTFRPMLGNIDQMEALAA